MQSLFAVSFVPKAWFVIIWTIFHEMSFASDVVDVSAIFFFACGVSLLAFPALFALVLERTDSLTFVLVAVLTVGIFTLFTQVALYAFHQKRHRKSNTHG